MRRGKCLKICSRKGFKFAGVQNGKECYCGNKFGKYKKLAIKKCSCKCKGNKKVNCGCKNTNLIFKTRFRRRIKSKITF